MNESTMGQVKTDDSISRQAAIEMLNENELARQADDVFDGDLHRYKRAAQRIIAQLPTIEPKKVVEDYCRPRNLMVVAAEDFHRLVEQMLQTIDVPDRKFGEWIAVKYNDGTVRTECSVCGYGRGLPPVRHYCPNCGAKMDEVEE